MKLKFSKTFVVFFVWVFIAVVYAHDNYWRSVWWDKWFFVMLACLSVICTEVQAKTDWTAGLLLYWTTFSALSSFAWHGEYDHAGLLTLMAVGKITAYNYAALLTLTLAALSFTKEDLRKVTHFMGVTCVANATLIVLQACIGKEATVRGGFFGNPSISGCLIAFTYPFVLVTVFDIENFAKDRGLRIRKALPFLYSFSFLTPVLAIILTGANQPVGVLAVVLVAFALSNHGRINRNVLILAGVVILLGFAVLIGHSNENKKVFATTGRAAIWEMATRWWWTYGSRWWGQGNGITQVLVPLIQKSQMDPARLQTSVDWWLWLHSDWLQLLFETGIVGFVLGCAFFWNVLKRSFPKDPVLFAAVCGVGATALFNFPAHFPLHALFSVLIFALVYKQPVSSRSFTHEIH